METRTNEATIAAALEERFYREIISSPGVASDSFICFMDGTISISAVHMKWVMQEPLFGPSTAVQDDDADDARNFAIIANTIPAIGTPWSASTTSLGPTFRSWLDAAVVPKVELSPDEERRLQEARKTIREGADLYYQYEFRWREAQRARQEAIRDTVSGPDHQKLVLTTKQAAEKAMLDWQVRGGKSRFESAVALKEYYLSLSQGLQSALAALRESYDKVFGMNRTRNGEHFTPVRLIPHDLFEGGASWISVSVQMGELPLRQETTSLRHGSGLDMPLFWISDSGSQRVRFSGINTSKVAVSFEFLYGGIDRSAWFDSLLLTSNSWWWNGATKSHPTFGGPMFSNGDPLPDTQGQWQMIPVGIIFTRNLVVTTEGFDLGMSEFVSRARSSATAGFWIFTVRNTVGSPLAGGYDFELETGSILRVPQVQIAAVVCQLMPKEPNPDPTLLTDRPS
jgi:hypothetical protein